MTAIESPCNQVCAVDPRSGLCIGCRRSIAEIERWTRYSTDERRRIMAELPGRLVPASEVRDTSQQPLTRTSEAKGH